MKHCLVKAVFIVNVVSLHAFADDKASAQSQDSDFEAAVAAANKAQVVGPVDVELRDQAALKIPAGFSFIPEKEAANLLKAMGNGGGREDLLGLITPVEDSLGSWFAVATYHDSGYIKDDDAKDWDADELFENLKNGAEESNKERKGLGFSEIELIGWVEKPHYDSTTHQLKWSASSKAKNNPKQGDEGVNYNTYVLGREGYISLNFVTGLSLIDSQKPIAQKLLDGLSFKKDKAYGDFNSSTDKIAAYGLGALVAGVAAKKLGLIAICLAFLAKFSKVIIVAVVASLAVIRRFFKRKETT